MSSTTDNQALKQYAIVTGNYWAFTLTDGALRMLVVLYFSQLGYSPLQVAMLFLFYEIFGVITNLVGGWLGARIGLNKTMNIGLGLQIVALAALLVPTSMLTVPWIMAAQAMSGIAKDLNKMSAKSSIKTLVPENASGKLFKWIAILTGSKNALKGCGFFLGGLLLTLFEFKGAVSILASGLAIVWVGSLVWLKAGLGKAKSKPKFTELFSKSTAINYLSAARLFLFGARDVWFVVALPVYLGSTLNWSHSYIGAFMASWIIAYGFVQGIAPKITQRGDREANGRTAALWAFALCISPALIALALTTSIDPSSVLIIGLLIFGALFAINSSLHSFLIVHYAGSDGVSLDVGFYYMANALGRLLGTLLSGWVFQAYGLTACLWVSAAMVLISAVIALKLPHSK